MENINIQFEAQCPKCGHKLFEQPAGLDLDAAFTCAGCGHTDQLAKFASAETIARLEQAALQFGGELFKNFVVK